MKRIEVPEVPELGHYSVAVAEKGFLFLSGLVAVVPGRDAIEFDNGSVADETTRIMRNAETILHAGGCTLGDIVRVEACIRSEDNRTEFNDAFASFMGEHRPARFTFVAAPPIPELNVEIQITASIPEKAPFTGEPTEAPTMSMVNEPPFGAGLE